MADFKPIYAGNLTVDFEAVEKVVAAVAGKFVAETVEVLMAGMLKKAIADKSESLPKPIPMILHPQVAQYVDLVDIVVEPVKRSSKHQNTFLESDEWELIEEEWELWQQHQ